MDRVKNTKNGDKGLMSFLSILLFIVFVFSSFVRGPFLPLGAIGTNIQHGASKSALAHALNEKIINMPFHIFTRQIYHSFVEKNKKISLTKNIIKKNIVL